MLDESPSCLLVDTHVLTLCSRSLNRLDLFKVLLHACQLPENWMILGIDTLQSQ